MALQIVKLNLELARPGLRTEASQVCLAHMPAMAAPVANHLKLGDTRELAAPPNGTDSASHTGRTHLIGLTFGATDWVCLVALRGI